jgi:hypothetical protein
MRLASIITAVKTSLVDVVPTGSTSEVVEAELRVPNVAAPRTES